MNTRNTIRRTVIAVALLLSAVAGLVAADADQPTLRVLTNPSFIPFEMLDYETGEMVGFDMAILAEVAERAGFDYTINTMSFRSIIPALQIGTADMAIAGITITPERERVVDFSIPYFRSSLRILVRSQNDDIHTLADLKGRSISTKIGSTSYKLLHRRFGPGTTIKSYTRTATMYYAVMSGVVDAAVYDAPNMLYFARKRGRGKVKVVGPQYAQQAYGIAFVEGSPWIDDVNAALRAMKQDGTYARIYRKWFHQPPPSMADEP